MAKTTRNPPAGQSAKQKRLEREWERQVEQFKSTHKPSAQPAQPVPEPTQAPAPAHIEALKAEAEKAIALRATPGGTAFSRQDPLPGQITEGKGLIWWTGGNIDDYIPLSEYGTRERQTDLRTFALVAPMILIAESVLIKKMQALQWSIEAGRNRAIQWQKIVANLEQNKGWDTFIARWTRAYCESDYGGPAEIIRRAPAWAVDREGNLTSRGEAAIRKGEDRLWPIIDAKVMDPTRCVPTGDPEFPLLFYNSYTGKKHHLRPHQFMRILDMPNVDDTTPNQGLCAVSRAVWAAQEDRMVTRYGFEALSENPGTGLIMANVNQNLLETALASAEGARDARGVVYYKGVIFLPILDPSGTTKLEYLTFSHLPENFNRTEDYSRIKEIVASAFGMDVLELGSIPGHNLGTSAQAEVGAAKARGKGIGALIQSVEREFRHKFLPSDVQLRIKKHDIDEQADRAELDTLYFNMATSMVQVGAWDPVLANQYLADKGAIQPEFPYLAADLTPSEELDDTEATEGTRTQAQVGEAAKRARDGPLCRVDRDGRITQAAHAYVQYAQKQLTRPQLPISGPRTSLDVREELDVRDMIGARALWAKYQPRYAELVGRGTPLPPLPAAQHPVAQRAVDSPPTIHVNVEPPAVTVTPQMPITVRAELFQPTETMETETIVDRDVSTGRITSTRKRTQRSY